MKKLRIFVLLICLLTASLYFYGCEEIKVESISFNQQKITVVVGSSDYEVFANVVENNSKLVATVLPYNAKNRAVTFEVDNSEIIEINNNRIIAKSEGVAHITATTKDGNFATSAVVEVVGEKSQLAAPTNIRFENGQIVWDQVENADYYTIVLNNGIHSETVENKFSDFESGISNKIQIKSNSVGNAYSSSEASEIFSFKQLSSPSVITNNNYNISWDSVVGAVGYDIFVDGVKVNNQILNITNYSITESLINDGAAHQISIMSKGNNTDTFESKQSKPYTVQVLSSPTAITLSQGVVMFNEVPYANSYNVKIGNKIYASSLTNFAIPEEITAGEHALTVQAVSSASNYIASSYSETVLNFIKLETIENFTVENNLISWNKVTNAGGYLISVNDIIYSLGTASNFYIGEEFNAGQYEIKIACVGTGTQYVMSNFSQGKTLTKLEVPQNLQILNGKVTYNGVSNATSYVLNINGSTHFVSGSEVVNNIASIDVSLDSGNYNIKVQAVGNGTEFLNSSFSESINTTKLDAPSTPVLENGLIKWKTVKNAFGYNVKLNEEIYEFNSLETEGNFIVLDLSSNQYTAENYSVQVQALSSEGNINSNYTTAVDFKKFKNPETIKSHLGNLAFSYNQNVPSYSVSVNGQVQTVSNADLKVDNVSNPTIYVYDFSFEKSVDSSLIIKIKANGNDEYISSDYSAETTFNVCAKLNNLEIKNNILSFTNSNAGNVLIECVGKTASGSAIKIDETSTTTSSFNLPMFMNESLPGGSYTFTLRAQGNSVNTLSGVKQILTTQILNAPTSFKIESGFLKWNGASNASGYKLQIFSSETKELVKEMEIGNVQNISLAGYTDLNVETDYLVSIQTMGNGRSTISSNFIDEGERVTASILSTPKNLKVIDGEIQWDTVENASVYGMYIDGILASIKSEEIETLQEGIPHGTHNIKVYAVGDNTKYLSSDISTTLEVVKLETPTDIYIKKDVITNKATLYCDMPAYARALLISTEFNNGEATEELYQQEANPTGITLDLSEYESGYYSFKAQAIGDSTKYISSSQTTTCSTTVMACPENVYLNKGVVTWSSVTGVLSYNIYIDYYGEENQGLVSSEEKLNIESNTYVLNTDFAKGYYQISVKAVGDESKFISSQQSTAINVEKLGIPTQISTKAGLIVFNELAGAYEYAIYVDGEECGRTKKENSNVISYELPEEVEAGTHQIMIQAIGDDTKYITGEAGATIVTGGASVEVVGATMEVIKLSTVNEFKLKNGVLTWLPIEIASGYSLKINQINFEEEVEQTTNKSSYVFGEDISAGTKTIRLKSIGQNLADGRRILNSNYTEELTAVKLEQVVNIHAVYGSEIENCGIITWNRIENNNGYIISIDGVSDEIVTEVNQESYEFVSSNIPSGDLKIKIKARGTTSSLLTQGNYISGDNSEEVTYNKLDTPSNFKIADGKLTWDYSSGYSFVVSVTSNGEESCFVVDEQSAVIDTEFDSGTYDIRVKAQGKVAEDGTNLLNSSYTEAISAVKPEKPLNVSVDAFGVVTWQMPENSLKPSGWVVKATYTAPGGTSATVEKTYENLTQNICYLGASGTYNNIKVYAVSEQGLYSDSSDAINTIYDGFAYGNGTAEDPYLVTNIDDFLRVSKYPTAYFVQTADIDMAGIEVKAMFADKIFTGSYNAYNSETNQYHTISNLTVIGSGTQELALFSTVGEGAIISNLTIINANIEISSQAGVGGIAGRNNGTIYNCSISGKVYNLTEVNNTSSSLNIGGVVAYNTAKGIVQLCESDVIVKGVIKTTTNNNTSYKTTNCDVTSGAISGTNYGTIKQCVALSNAKIYGNVSGGISGSNNALIEQCVNNASVEATNIKIGSSIVTIIDGHAGGIVGSNASNNNAIIYNCYNLSANIKCVNTSINSQGYYLYAGGIAAKNNSKTGKAKIINCYNYAPITPYVIDGIEYYNSGICHNGSTAFVVYYYSNLTTEDALKGTIGDNVITTSSLTEEQMKTQEFAQTLNTNISLIALNSTLSALGLSTEECWKLLSTGVVGFEWQEPTQQ